MRKLQAAWIHIWRWWLYRTIYQLCWPWVYKKMRVISHNFKGYDANFVIKELMKRNWLVEPTLNGQKILTIRYNEYIQFIDSLNYLPMPLSNFNSAFGLNPDIYGCKGYSSYMFNTKANWNYEGIIPSIEYFDLSRFNEEKKKEFLHCTQDVRLLQAGCLRFMEDIMNLTDVNPFQQCITLSQVVLCIFKKNSWFRIRLGFVLQAGMVQNKINRELEKNGYYIKNI